MTADAIAGFRLDAVHTFQIRTLASLGYRTRVALSNASAQQPALATAYRVDATVYRPDGTRDRTVRDLGTLEPGRKLVIDCGDLETGADGDIEIIFHLIPLRLAAAAVDALIAITRAELLYLFGVQDHYVEYFRDDGFAAGVLYSSGAFNYPKAGRDWTSILQAPKGYVASDLDTLFSVVSSSPDPSFAATARLKCSLQIPSAHRQVAWTEELRPFVPRSISLRARAEQLGVALGPEPTFVCFMAICETATVLPLTINRDLRTGCIGIEHSLPPIYYSTAMTGKLRARTVAAFAKAEMFES